MPYPIKGSLSVGGVASYQLGRDEELEIGAVTFVADTSASFQQNIAFVDWRDASNTTIYRQPLGVQDQFPVLYTLADDGEPWFIEPGATTNFPQTAGAYTASIVSLRIPLLTLAPGCSLLAYTIPAASLDPLADPLASVDTLCVVSGLHLWVEDTLESKFRQLPPPAPVGPYMLVPGPNA